MIKGFKQASLVALAVLTVSSTAQSREISYNYIQGTYASIDDTSIPGYTLNANGFAVTGSFDVAPNIAIAAGFESNSYDEIQGVDISSDFFAVGITLHTSTYPGTSVFANISFVDGQIELTDGIDVYAEDDTGNSIGIGLRHMANEMLEIDLSISRLDIADDTSSTFSFGARLYANDQLSLGLGYGSGDDTDALLLDARINF